MSYFEDESSPLSDLDNLEMMVNELMEMDNASLNNINGRIKKVAKKIGGVVKNVVQFCKENLPTCLKIVAAIL